MAGAGPSFGMLHFFRSLEAQQIDTLLQDVLGQANEGDITSLEILIRLCEDPGFMVEGIYGSGQLIDIATDEIGGGVPVSPSKAGASLVMVRIRSFWAALAGA